MLAEWKESSSCGVTNFLMYDLKLLYIIWLLLCAINCDRVSTGTVLNPGGSRQTANVTVLLRYGQCSSVNVTGTIRYG